MLNMPGSNYLIDKSQQSSPMAQAKPNIDKDQESSLMVLAGFGQKARNQL